MTKPRPLMCPKCKSVRAHRIGVMVQPWHGWFDISLGVVYGCWDCRLTYCKMNDGQVHPLRGVALESLPPERNGAQSKPAAEAVIEALRSRVGDKDASWG